MSERGGTLVISAAALSEIEAAARSFWPRECCGLLVGVHDQTRLVWQVTDIVSAPNVAPVDQPDRFEVAPEVLFATLRRLEGSSKRIVGHYHSHPNGLDRPSATDASMRFYADHVWLIASLFAPDGEILVSAWRPTLDDEPAFTRMSVSTP